jgi:hypothetical protein
MRGKRCIIKEHNVFLCRVPCIVLRLPKLRGKINLLFIINDIFLVKFATRYNKIPHLW